MADYFPLLARALDTMSDRSPDMRRVVYDRARAALLTQLRAIDPPLGEDAIERERLALDDAVSRAEEVYGLDSPPVPVPEPVVDEAVPPAAERPRVEQPSAIRPTRRRNRSLALAIGLGVVMVPVAITGWLWRDRPAPAPREAARVAAPPPASDVKLADRISGAPRPTSPANPPAATSPAARAPTASTSPPPVPSPTPSPTPSPSRTQGPETIAAATGTSAPTVAPPTETSAPTGAAAPAVVAPPAAPPSLSAQAPSPAAPSPSRAASPATAPAAPTPAGSVPQAPPVASSAPRTSQPELAVAQRALLVEENTADPQQPTITSGRALWRLDVLNGGQGLPLETVVRTNIELPEAALALTMTLRRNTDPAFPASHTLEMVFTSKNADDTNRVVRDVGLPQLKSDEVGRGSPLAGLSVPVKENVFLIGLSDLKSDVERNSDLLLHRNWIDLPLRFASGQRAVLSFEKGVAGERVMADAFKQWPATAP